MLLAPDFTLPQPNPRRDNTTDAVWWLRCRLLELESSTEDGGTYANKPGFHGRGRDQVDHGQGASATNYSIRDGVDRTGPWWRDFSSAFDWTFRTAQGGNYDLIATYSSRLYRSATDSSDPRLDLVLFEFFGQTDHDSHVEGYDELHEHDSTSDSSHLWHIHMSFIRSKVGDFWGMWALYTVLIGWTVEQWRASLPADQVPPPPAPELPWPQALSSGMPTLRRGSNGRPVRHLQAGLNVHSYHLTEDGDFGPATEGALRSYQGSHGLEVDGIAGDHTWWSLVGQFLGELQRGATGHAVTVMQAQANTFGAGLTEDGDFGPATEAAVRNIQRSNAIGVDGIVGPITWRVLLTR